MTRQRRLIAPLSLAMGLAPLCLVPGASAAEPTEEVLVAPPSECAAHASDKHWALTTDTSLGEVIKALAAQSCERYIVPRSLLSTKVVVDVGREAMSALEMRKRVEAALRAKGIVLEPTSASRVRRASDPASSAPARSTVIPRVAPEQLDKGIECKADRCTIKRAVFEGVLADTAGLGASARLVPAYAQGRVEGVKLYAIVPGSYLARLGLQNGDMILSIDGVEMSSPERTLELYTRLAKMSTIKVELKRRGEPVHMVYVVN